MKYRKALLSDQVREAILAIADGIQERYDVEFENIGTDGDHIHLLCSFHPKYSGSAFVGMCKSITAKQLFRRLPELRKELWGGEFWSNGFYLATTSKRGDWETVRRYVANQGKGKTDAPTQLKLWR